MGTLSVWSKGYYDVPDSWTEEMAQAVSPKYTKRFGEHLEREGFTILCFLKPVVAGAMEHNVFCEPDKRRYSIFAQVTRQPKELHFEIPDYAVPEMSKILTLAE
ncbi:hypothetical protein LCGC14_1290860 [marine sediment metagenome]|uniref:Uncharacterized protein n=1 Tax=marine sediment metagenome TaxID=412755 RepID=A0A0F9KU34_9ZZZZ